MSRNAERNITRVNANMRLVEVKSTASEFAFIRVLRLGLRLQTSSEDFGLLLKTTDFFGNLRK